MKLLLDTHTLIWMASNPARLGAAFRTLTTDGDTRSTRSAIDDSVGRAACGETWAIGPAEVCAAGIACCISALVCAGPLQPGARARVRAIEGTASSRRGVGCPHMMERTWVAISDL